jgi:hypothetical protein
MSYGLLDPTLWYNLPGVVAAYQPVMVPDPIRARYNVGLNHALEGSFTATPGVAPTWNSRTGWSFDGTQWLDSQVIPTISHSLLVRYTNAIATATYCVACALYEEATKRFGVYPIELTAKVYYGNGNYIEISPQLTSGVLGIAGRYGYRNGLLDTSSIGTGGPFSIPLYFGALNLSGTAYSYKLNIQSLAIYSRTLSASEVWLASQQMAYCDQNPAWSAWTWKTRTFYSYASLGRPRILPELATIGPLGAPHISPDLGRRL